ncbi:hydantoinase/oxoprolinase family protein [Sulfitobacter sp. MF3-043]|uniref:hydantoinase/oxoprolinase family protein n=1 Tax=Sulfitobacter sediminivivens TaxID=3252902 RepID=UPI0036DC7069
MTHIPQLRLAIDIGGTFTDTVLVDGTGQILASTKTPTTPANPTDGALAGARHVLEEAGKDWADIGGFIHGTTLATNALIERRGACVASITNAGFRDILEIAYERRYAQYDINLVKADLIVPRARSFTIGGRMDVQGQELTPLDRRAITSLVGELKASGADAVAVCLLHSYANPAHEIALRDLLGAALPQLHISLSHEVSPEAREFDRLCTTIANAYVQPLMARYLDEFQTCFARQGLNCPILMMTAGGGMTTLDTAARLPIRLVESGPAGGAILAARIAAQTGEGAVLSFDMGGTTAKLCLIDDYRPQMARQFEIARAARFTKGSGLPVRIPVLEMIEIGAGGGSIAGVDRLGRLTVGPQSAGAEPGPAAFGKGGTDPTVTDADVTLGYIQPDRFAEGRLQIDQDAAAQALCCGVGAALALDATLAARGVSEIVDESMASAGRMHAVESGKQIDTRLMIAFGGNGPLHATRVARRAGVSRILIQRDPGVGSAVGFLFAPVGFEIVRSRYALLDGMDVAGLNRFLTKMTDEATQVVRQGAPVATLSTRRQAFMRYHGQGHEIEIDLPHRDLTTDDIETLRIAFEVEYGRQFSRAVPGMDIEVLNWAVHVSSDAPALTKIAKGGSHHPATPTDTREIICDVTGSPVHAGIFDRAELLAGSTLNGPALITEPQTTTLVSADFSARIDGVGNIWLSRLTEVMT